MFIQINGSHCILARATQDEAAWIGSLLRVEDKAAMEARQYRQGVNTGGATPTIDLSWRDVSGRVAFPCGLLPIIQKAATKKNFEVGVIDTREHPELGEDFEERITNGALELGGRDYQIEAILAAHNGTSPSSVIEYPLKGRGIIKHATGCHARGQLVLMSDGSTKLVEDICVGDHVMGEHSEPRVVLELHRGRAAMARIVPTKGTPFVVNLDHVLTLERTSKYRNDPQAGCLVDVSVREWLDWNDNQKHLHKLVKRSIELPESPVPIDPYVLGVILGDGNIDGSVTVTTTDKEIADSLKDYWGGLGYEIKQRTNPAGCHQYRLSNRRGEANPLVVALKSMGLSNTRSSTKFVPNLYKQNSKKIRAAVLAGLLDTDGSYDGKIFDYISKSSRLAEDVEFLARSLGLAAYTTACQKTCTNSPTRHTGTYYRVCISGELSIIPTRIKRKQATPRTQKKNVLRTGFTVELMPEDDFYGFTLDGDGRFLLGDFTLTHNSGKSQTAAMMAILFPGKWVFIVHRSHLAADVKARYEKLSGMDCGSVMEGEWNPGEKFTVATIQSLHSLINTEKFRSWAETINGVIIDECFPSGTLVDGVPIEKIKEGDVVTSFCEKSKTIVKRRVTGLHKSPAGNLVRLSIGDKQLVCTAGHPLLTKSGWLPAFLAIGEEVLQHDDQNSISRAVPVSGMWNTSNSGEQKQGQGLSEPRVLLRRPQNTKPFRINAKGGQFRSLDSLSSHEEGQPNESSRNPGEGHEYSTNARRLETQNSGWEWTGLNQTTENSSGSPRERLGTRVRSENAQAQGERLSIPLQNRHCQPQYANSSGSRREHTQGNSPQSPGPKENGTTYWARVDSFEILEPGSDGTYGGLCPDGCVYNLSVEGTETYIADNTVVHNCHTCAAETHSAVAFGFKNAFWKIGLSGTPLDRSDKKSILCVAAIGPIVHEKKPGDLIEEGYLARPTIKIIPVWQPQYSGYGGWPEIYEQLIKNSAHRNGALVAAMVAHDAPGIVFVKHLDHGKEIVRRARAKGLDVDFVHGSWSLQRRQQVIRKLNTGELQWVVASSVFNEGVDIPCLRTVVLGCGGRSIIQTLQQIGRGTRKTSDKDVFTVVDIGDKGDRRLNDHSKSRILSCQREGYKCVVEPNLWPERAPRQSLPAE